MKEKKELTPEQKKKFNIGCLAVIVLVVVIAVIGGSGDEEKAKGPVDARKEKIEAQFSKWDGSHNKLTEMIKESMNDPESFKHVETKFIDMDSCLWVTETYRGKNAFGGVVTENIQAFFTLDGEFIKLDR